MKTDEEVKGAEAKFLEAVKAVQGNPDKETVEDYKKAYQEALHTFGELANLMLDQVDPMGLVDKAVASMSPWLPTKGSMTGELEATDLDPDKAIEEAHEAGELDSQEVAKYEQNAKTLMDMGWCGYSAKVYAARMLLGDRKVIGKAANNMVRHTIRVTKYRVYRIYGGGRCTA